MRAWARARAEGEVEGVKAKGEWVRPSAKAEIGGLLRAEVPGQGHGMGCPRSGAMSRPRARQGREKGY